MNIIGASGHGKVIIDTLRLNRMEITGVWDDDPRLKDFNGFQIKGTVDDCIKIKAFPVIIGIGNNNIRKKIADKFISGSAFGKAFHPSAAISKDVTIGEGTVIMANASVNAGCRIGKHVIVNTNASVDHDCTLGDYVHISPQAGLAGNVTVGEGSHIGIGASIIQNISIGKWCTIGAGAVILSNVPDGATVAGNPGKIIRING